MTEPAPAESEDIHISVITCPPCSYQHTGTLPAFSCAICHVTTPMSDSRCAAMSCSTSPAGPRACRSRCRARKEPTTVGQGGDW